MKKKIFASLLAAAMLLSLVACGGKKDDNVVKMGVLEASGMEGLHSGAHDEHMKKDNVNADKPKELVNYGSLSSALMDLESGKIAYVVVEASTANYVAARNENIIVRYPATDCVKTNFSMMTMENKIMAKAKNMMLNS